MWGINVRERARRRRARTATARLWRDLCDAHGLRRAERRLLLRAAGEIGLVSPALFFLKPSAFGAFLGEPRTGLTEAQRERMRHFSKVFFPNAPSIAPAPHGARGDDDLPLFLAPDALNDLPPWEEGGPETALPPRRRPGVSAPPNT
jgi:hypothetical protein